MRWSGRAAPEAGYLGVKIAGQKKNTRLSGRWVAKRVDRKREKGIVGSVGQEGAKEERDKE